MTVLVADAPQQLCLFTAFHPLFESAGSAEPALKTMSFEFFGRPQQACLSCPECPLQVKQVQLKCSGLSQSSLHCIPFVAGHCMPVMTDLPVRKRTISAYNLSCRQGSSLPNPSMLSTVSQSRVSASPPSMGPGHGLTPPPSSLQCPSCGDRLSLSMRYLDVQASFPMFCNFKGRLD